MIYVLMSGFDLAHDYSVDSLHSSIDLAQQRAARIRDSIIDWGTMDQDGMFGRDGVFEYRIVPFYIDDATV